jgi:hypothetical protein
LLHSNDKFSDFDFTIDLSDHTQHCSLNGFVIHDELGLSWYGCKQPDVVWNQSVLDWQDMAVSHYAC